MATLPDLSRRVCAAELMDDPGLSPREHVRALRGLARLNAVAGSARLLWPALERRASSAGSRPLRVLDVATGSGDVPLALARRARRKAVAIDVYGCDISERAVEVARGRAGRAGLVDAEARFFAHDALKGELPRGFDIIMCSLFLHHLDDEQAAALLYRMRCAADGGVLVSDLERCRAGFMLAWGASRTLTRSRVVHSDAVRSVRAAFTRDEFAELALSAGMQGAMLRRCWPWRLVLEWTRGDER